MLYTNFLRFSDDYIMITVYNMIYIQPIKLILT